MTTENKKPTEQGMNTDSQKSDFHDDFDTKDQFTKEKVSVRQLDVKKALIFVFGGLALIALLTAGVYAKFKKNKEARQETGIENSISKPVDQTDGNTNQAYDNFGFNRTNPNDANENVTSPPEKTPEQLEAEQRLAEQQAQLALQQQQAEQEALAREQALLTARQKSGILVDSNSSKGGNSPNGNADAMAGIPPELQPLFAGMQVQGGQSNQGGTGNVSSTNKSEFTQIN